MSLDARKIHIGRRTYRLNAVLVGWSLLLPSLAFMIFIFVIPLVQVISLSFSNFSMITGTGKNIGLRNYEYLLGNDRFWNAMFNTVKYAAFKLTVDTTLALMIAVMLDRNIPGKRFLRASYFSPVVVPVVASSLIWIWFYDPSVGPFNQILSFLGLPTSRWLYHENTALLSILIFSVWKGLGYNMILFLSGLQNIPDSYLEAARMDGATEMKVFFKIKLPLLRPITSFIIMMGVINSFKVFTEINVMTPDGGPLGSTTLIVNYIYDQAFTSGRMGRASAAALLLFVVIFLLTELQRAINAKKHVDLV
ncbi:MAG: carbohydrate ABC transporter permease [Christensenellales bacterium]|jgi:multiple sugar transport system permease protein